MHANNDDEVTLDDLRAAHPGTPGQEDGNAWIAALDEGWSPSEILRAADLYARLIKHQGGTARSVGAWLGSLGRPPERSGR